MAGRVRSTPLQVGDQAPVLLLTDHTRRELALASLWQRQPLVLFFVRHFG